MVGSFTAPSGYKPLDIVKATQRLLDKYSFQELMMRPSILEFAHRLSLEKDLYKRRTK